jgi:hypothetical protein
MRARASARSFVVGMVALASGLAAAQAPPQNQPPQRGRGFVVGQVVDAADGRPIPGAIVSIGGGTGPVEAGLVPFDVTIVPTAAPRQVITDAAGRFFFRELSPGSYTIRANAFSGYLSGAYGASRPGGLAQSVVLERDDDRRGGLTIRLWQAALINGRIIDEFGEPAIGMQVRSFRRTFSGGRARLSPGPTATTDDRGVYRFSGLTPGEYLVALMFTSTSMPISAVDAYMQAASAGSSAMEQLLNERTSSGAPFPSTSGFRVGDHMFSTSAGRGGSLVPAPSDDGPVMSVPTTFYPGATSVSQATVLTLASGEDRTGVDFQIKPRRAVSVSGVVTGPDGPVTNVGVRLLISGAEEFASLFGTEAALTSTDAAGRFTFLGVTSGTYTLQSIRVPRATAPRTSPTTSIEVAGPGGLTMGIMSGGPVSTATLPLPQDPTLWATMPLTVGESDLHNVSVAMRPGARLSGRLVFEGGEPPPADILQRANITISPMMPGLPSQVSSAQKRVETDGRFATVGYPAGRYNVNASIPVVSTTAAPATPAWRFKYARIGGRDLTDEGLEVGTSDITALELVFGTTTTEISGTVVDAKGLPDAGALVVVMPADSSAWKSGVISTRRVRAARTTTTGAYTLGALPAGEYFIAAIPEGAFESWQEPRSLEAISRLAARISLGDGNKLSQRLTTVTSIK